MDLVRVVCDLGLRLQMLGYQLLVSNQNKLFGLLDCEQGTGEGKLGLDTRGFKTSCLCLHA